MLNGAVNRYKEKSQQQAKAVAASSASSSLKGKNKEAMVEIVSNKFNILKSCDLEKFGLRYNETNDTIIFKHPNEEIEEIILQFVPNTTFYISKKDVNIDDIDYILFDYTDCNNLWNISMPGKIVYKFNGVNGEEIKNVPTKIKNIIPELQGYIEKLENPKSNSFNLSMIQQAQQQQLEEQQAKAAAAVASSASSVVANSSKKQIKNNVFENEISPFNNNNAAKVKDAANEQNSKVQITAVATSASSGLKNANSTGNASGLGSAAIESVNLINKNKKKIIEILAKKFNKYLVNRSPNFFVLKNAETNQRKITMLEYNSEENYIIVRGNRYNYTKSLDGNYLFSSVILSERVFIIIMNNGEIYIKRDNHNNNDMKMQQLINNGKNIEWKSVDINIKHSINVYKLFNPKFINKNKETIIEILTTKFTKYLLNRFPKFFVLKYGRTNKNKFPMLQYDSEENYIIVGGKQYNYTKSLDGNYLFSSLTTSEKEFIIIMKYGEIYIKRDNQEYKDMRRLIKKGENIEWELVNITIQPGIYVYNLFNHKNNASKST